MTMNVIAMLRTLAESVAEGERISRHGVGFREKLRGQELENQRSEIENADLPGRLQRTGKIQGLALTAEEERQARRLHLAKAAGIANPTPEAIAGLESEQAEERRKAEMAKLNAEVDTEKIALEAKKQGLPNARPNLSPVVLDYIAPTWSPDSAVGPQPGPTNTDIDILTQKKREEASVRAAGMRQSPRSEFGLTPYQQVQTATSLSKQYQTNTRSARLISQQFQVMESAMGLLESGQVLSRNAITQGIITPFNKIMDPASVVRESEYARGPQGQALMATIEGKLEALALGGPGLTPESLKEFVIVAREFYTKSQESARFERQRAIHQARVYGIDPTLITGEGVDPNIPGGDPTIPAPSGTGVSGTGGGFRVVGVRPKS